MTDEDVIAKVGNMWNVRVVHHGNMYKVQVGGSYAIGWMMTLYTFLGKRRKEKVVLITKIWREHIHARASKGIRAMAKCHPDRIVRALGRCDYCYGKHWRKKEKLRLVG